MSCVINCIRGVDKPDHLPPAIQYIHIALDDEPTERLQAYIDTVVSIIGEHRDRGGTSLVYCGRGISRSAAFCIASMMQLEQNTLRQAYQHVQSRRPCICPNVGFFKQLIDFERKLTGKKTVEIVEAAPGLFMADVLWEELKLQIENKQDSADGVGEKVSKGCKETL